MLRHLSTTGSVSPGGSDGTVDFITILFYQAPSLCLAIFCLLSQVLSLVNMKMTNWFHVCCCKYWKLKFERSKATLLQQNSKDRYWKSCCMGGFGWSLWSLSLYVLDVETWQFLWHILSVCVYDHLLGHILWVCVCARVCTCMVALRHVWACCQSEPHRGLRPHNDWVSL